MNKINRKPTSVIYIKDLHPAIKADTAWCQHAIIQLFGKNGDKPKSWKRTSKKQDAISATRLFAGPDNRVVRVIVTKDQAQLEEVKNQVQDSLIEAAAKIRHCGDYGNLYYNAKKHQVLWVGGDSDGQIEEGYTDFKTIKKLLKVPGITSVTIADESGPDEDDGAWEDLGQHGVAINPQCVVHFSSERNKLNRKLIQHLQPGWVIMKLPDYYAEVGPESLCHVREDATHWHVYSFHNGCSYHFEKGKPLPIVMNIFYAVISLKPEYDDAIRDIYTMTKQRDYKGIGVAVP